MDLAREWGCLPDTLRRKCDDLKEEGILQRIEGKYTSYRRVYTKAESLIDRQNKRLSEEEKPLTLF